MTSTVYQTASETADLILEDLPPELMVKHPLQNNWSVWFYKNEKGKTWEQNLMKIASFDTVEDFWAIYNHIESANKLPPGCDYAVFKNEIKPMWEDEKNKNGGRWLINLLKQQRNTELVNYWLEILLGMIGEAYDDFNDDICGAVVQVRARGDKLALWTTDVNHEAAIWKIGKATKERLGSYPRVTMIYEAHAELQSKAAAAASKNRYLL